MYKQWENFKQGNWQKEIDVRNFIQKNYKHYDGDSSFLSSISEKTKKLLDKVENLITNEIQNNNIKIDLDHISGINNFVPGYIDKDNELIVGLQTDEPLKRIMNPFGGTRMVEQSLESYGYNKHNPLIEDFKKYRKTHNDGVFSAYTEEMRVARHVGLLTGLPDAYGRGRIIGDYRRIALYGIDYLIEDKKKDFKNLKSNATEDVIRKREEITEQIKALKQIKDMAKTYNCDISKPSLTAQEAIQALYFGYLAAVKEANGAAMSLGRTSTFLDIYIERDLNNGILNEQLAQELIDQFIIKLRLVRHLRTPEYNELYGGDPTWVTESIGGISINGKSLVTKTSYRYLHTLTNLGTSPEPNMTILWSEKLPKEFKEYCAKMSIDTDALQYENDDLMRPIYGDDYGIACCVSAMEIGKRMQFFGARCNLAKQILYAINGGYDEKELQKDGNLYKVVPNIEKLIYKKLDYNEVMENLNKVIEWTAELYVDTMNTIHYMHDKYAYEAGEMALLDSDVKRFMAFGIAGLSCATDSLSAIKYAKVTPIINEKGIAIDFNIEGNYPKYGNDDDRADDIAILLVRKFSDELKKYATYRNAEHTLSVLTITSNVVYGKKTGSTPDGRKAGEPLAPGANPMHGRDENGALASLNSVAKIPYREYCQDGISNTWSITNDALGKTIEQRINNLVGILDGYFNQSGFHLNINVIKKEMLIDAYNHPEKYPTLTIRVSGYAVHFNKLSKEQQLEVIKRTIHENI